MMSGSVSVLYRVQGTEIPFCKSPILTICHIPFSLLNKVVSGKGGHNKNVTGIFSALVLLVSVAVFKVQVSGDFGWQRAEHRGTFSLGREGAEDQYHHISSMLFFYVTMTSTVHPSQYAYTWEQSRMSSLTTLFCSSIRRSSVKRR